MRLPAALLALAIGLTLLVYSNGLNGPFLFDDHIHITQNKWVKIESLQVSELAQAWDSSFSSFPANRPLAQLSFGINHALAGLNPWAFKTTNLAIHLIIGLLVFVFARLAYRAVATNPTDTMRGNLFAAATAALWLLHPLHVSTVLYTVQRMAQLSTLSMLLGLTCDLFGRLRIADGKPGRAWMLSAAPIALIGFLAKENTVLLPLLLLSVELTLLAGVSAGDQQRFLRWVRVVYIAVPLIAGLGYVITHPEIYSYVGRPFTLEERLLTQARVLWLYLQWMLVPDVSAFALFHDDLVKSTGLFSPPTTLFAVVGLVVALLAAIALRRRQAVFAFAALFFLANHALESTIFPLELMFEHRNYLASLGPLMLLAYLVAITSARLRTQSAAVALGALLLISYSVVTWIRVDNWSSYQKFVLSAVENHPESRRSHFMAAQLFIAAIDKSEGDTAGLAEAARYHLDEGARIDPRCLDCLFGKIALDLQLGQSPPQETIDRLVEHLRNGDVGPTSVSISQFSFMSRWHRSDGHKLTPEQLESIFDAARANPGWNHTGRAGLESAYREYHEFVTQDLGKAGEHARAAVAAWPDQWAYHVNLVRVLRKQGRHAEALRSLQKGAAAVGNETQRQELERLIDEIRRNLQNSTHANN